jgi:hypothetical protein
MVARPTSCLEILEGRDAVAIIVADMNTEENLGPEVASPMRRRAFSSPLKS